MNRILLFLILPLQLFSQIVPNNIQQEDIQQNILTYRIRHSDNNYKSLFPNCNQSLLLEFEKLKDTFNIPGKKWYYYKVINNNYSFVTKDGHSKTQSILSHGIQDSYLNRNNLIAIDENNEIVYLGGVFTKSSIAHNFPLSIKNYESFIPFLSIKLYNYNIDHIKLKRRTKNYILFEAYSKTLLRKIQIKVDSKNFEEITVVNY